jgi:ribosomal protein L29
MKKIIKEFEEKSISTLEQEAQGMRQEIATMNLNYRVNPSKDTNNISKKRKKLAVLLTVLVQKKMKKQ